MGPTPQAAGTRLLGSELLAWRQQRLREGGRSADLDWLLDLGAGLRWTQLQRVWLDPCAPLPLDAELSELTRLWRLHLESHTPLQYLVGVCPWRQFSLAVSEAVLIPRQETEVLADLAIDLARSMPGRASGPLTWADLGTGSGCLALALAVAVPQARGLAVDCSGPALAQASSNLQRAGVGERVELQLGSWWEPLRHCWGSLDLVVSNPLTFPRLFSPSSIRWCASMSRFWPLMEALTGWRRSGTWSVGPRRHWLPAACCCWSTITISRIRWLSCWALLGWWR